MLGFPLLAERSMMKERESDSCYPSSRHSILKLLHLQPLFSLQSADYVSRLEDLLPGHAVSILPFQRTDADVKAFLKAHLYQGATDTQIDSIADKYSQDPAAVSYLTYLPKTIP